MCAQNPSTASSIYMCTGLEDSPDYGSWSTEKGLNYLSSEATRYADKVPQLGIAKMVLLTAIARLGFQVVFHDKFRDLFEITIDRKVLSLIAFVVVVMILIIHVISLNRKAS